MSETENQEPGGKETSGPDAGRPRFKVRVSFPYPACLRFDCANADEAESLYLSIRHLLLRD